MHVRMQIYLIRRRHNKAVVIVCITVDFVYLVYLSYLLLHRNPFYLLLYKDPFLRSPPLLDFVAATAATT
jgi:hypothetical protein